jgi:3-phenylpropionate/trans-cinnamate dioxygenase ferredoxin reductase subunit
VRLRQLGFDLPGVHYLRTLTDAEAIRAGIEAGTRVVVVGASFIGSEVAASARMRGAAVTMVDPVSAPMATALGEEVGKVFAGIHRAHGVDLRMGTRVVELRGHGRVEEAVTAEGEHIPCDLVVVGVGVRPETGLFAGTGLEIDNGIVVDQFCATNVAGVYAAGDVANWWHPSLERRIRVEHFDNAALQGTAAGRSMAGQPEAYAPVPYFWSDQYDVNLQYAGFPRKVEEIVLRGAPETGSVTVFYLAGGRIQGVATINQSRDLRPVRQLIEADARIDPAKLADQETDLRALARQIRAVR